MVGCGGEVGNKSRFHKIRAMTAAAGKRDAKLAPSRRFGRKTPEQVSYALHQFMPLRMS